MNHQVDRLLWSFAERHTCSLSFRQSSTRTHDACSGREVMCERFRFPIGCEPNGTIGSPRPQLIEESCFAGSTK
jgi:hypothetical protein